MGWRDDETTPVDRYDMFLMAGHDKKMLVFAS